MSGGKNPGNEIHSFLECSSWKLRQLNHKTVVLILERTLDISFQSLHFIIEKAAARRKRDGRRGQSHILELSSQAKGRHRRCATEKSFTSRSPQLPFVLVPTSPIMSFPWKWSISGQGCQLRPPIHHIPKGEVNTWVEGCPIPSALEWAEISS